MKKVLFILLLVIILAPALVVGAFFAGVIKTPQVVRISSQWGEVTHDTTKVTTAVDVENPNSLGVNLADIGADVRIDLNGVSLGRGAVSGLKLPAGRSTTSVVTTIDNTKIPDWWASHINAKEQTKVQVVPKATLGFIGNFTVQGPTITRDFATDLLAMASSTQPEKMDAGPFTITLVRRTFEWGAVTPESTGMSATLVLRNDGTAPVSLAKIAFTVSMNTVTVAQGESLNGPIVLLAGQEQVVPVRISINNVKLLDWWPTHIAAKEVTQYSVRLDGVLEANLPFLGRQRIPVPLMTFSDELKTNVLGQ
jgi:LEA14-like dessication related protein